MARNPFKPKDQIASLSTQDLLDARSLYHAHLTNKENVIATAIGLYRILRDDENAHSPERTSRAVGSDVPRTLANTTIKPWSWPCVLVFVRKWQSKDKFNDDPSQIVPPFLYMPDGRIVPTCVVLAEEVTRAPNDLRTLNFPTNLIGGGYPLLIDNQGRQVVGSIGCLVTDGNCVYALTNKHVAGEAGSAVYTLLRNKRYEIGNTHANHSNKVFFETVYPGWKAHNTYSHVDAALIRLHDLNDWTAQIFGLGELGPMLDLNTRSITLNLIGCPVKAFGAASGELKGEIQALFYKYKSVGGFDYVADLLIGPKGNSELLTRPGDSGTIWCYDEPAFLEEKTTPQYQPMAMQWGGHILSDEATGKTPRYALATCLSTICRILDVEIIPDWNLGQKPYWGKLGHYKIASTACDLTDLDLPIISANRDSIAFSDEAIEAGELAETAGMSFIPLADVPDLVWRATRKKDDSNHFADIDEEGKDVFRGQSLLSMFQETESIDLETWNSFYDDINVGAKRGALPFRVKQIFEEMVAAVEAEEFDKFVCAAGIISHYVGDACQPLHSSYLHHGRSEAEKDVHSVYETRMLDRFAADLIEGINSSFYESPAEYQSFADSSAVANATMSLMVQTQILLPPEEILDAFSESSGRARVPHMWDSLGKRTVECMRNGVILLASIWRSAWELGGGDNNVNTVVPKRRLRELYENKAFLEAKRLREY